MGLVKDKLELDVKQLMHIIMEAMNLKFKMMNGYFKQLKFPSKATFLSV